MSSKKDSYSWPVYVCKVAKSDKRAVIAKKAGISSSAASRWLTGTTKPTNAAHVAQFAVACERSPVEAFVAAGLLSLTDAVGALDERALQTLAEVESAHVVTKPTETKRSRTTGSPKRRP